MFAQLLDNQFEFLGIRFGVNALLDLFPEIGDLLAAILSLYLIWIALQMHVPKVKILKMIQNILINFFIGVIPIVGDIAYVFRKANIKNLRILQQYAREQENIVEGTIII